MLGELDAGYLEGQPETGIVFDILELDRGFYRCARSELQEYWICIHNDISSTAVGLYETPEGLHKRAL